MVVKSNVSFLYNTNYNSKTAFDCFYAHIIDNRKWRAQNVSRADYLTPYCRRPSLNDSIGNIQGYIQSTETFKSLRSKGISSEDLLKSSMSLDIIEQYAIYLITNDITMDEINFNNCSSFWFGSQCQYTFGLNIIIDSFGDFVNSSFNSREQFHNKILINTCYPHLSGCYRGPEPMCLDWREICNGIIDCIGEHNFGIDEEYCNELEVNKCKEDEYRCHNGAQCIPLEFFHDGWTSKDCLDGTDEVDIIKDSPLYMVYIEIDCIKTLLFECEERSCRDPRSFPCGDGQCRRYGLIDNYFYPNGLLCPGTSRDFYYLRAIYASTQHLTMDCQKLLICKLRFHFTYTSNIYDHEHCSSDDWLSSNNCSMNSVSFPADPIFNGYFQVIYSSSSLINNLYNDMPPDSICYDPRQCLYLSNKTFQIDGLHCLPFKQVVGQSHIAVIYYLHSALADLAHFCSVMGNKNEYESNSTLFYCEESYRYISKHRLIDGINDCYHNEDEMYADSCSLNDSQRFRCILEEKCLSPISIDVALPNCEDNTDIPNDYHRLLTFGLLCDGTLEYIDPYGENDESNCEWWPCNNPYTRCDNVFQCGNGIDEINCPNFNCSTNELKCAITNSFDYQCMNRDYIYEMPVDCSMYDSNETMERKLFYSRNFTNPNNEYLSWKEKTCLTNDDICGCQSVNNQHLICNSIYLYTFLNLQSVLDMDNNELLCAFTNIYMCPFSRFRRFFSTQYLGYLPPTVNTTSLSSGQFIDIKPVKTLPMDTSVELIEYCNRGIVIYEGKSLGKKCLCPPNYFGDRCQWQNQRVSLTLRIRKQSVVEKNNSIYHIFIYLIDDENGIIHYYEEINYIPSIDCHTKYNRYLLYPTKPKNKNHTYSIHIDVYDKLTFDYYGSWYLNIPFPFLPVNRISTKMIISSEKPKPLMNCSLDCGIHGKCFYYFNSTKSFCRCDKNYSGRFCHLKHQCSCSPDSICLNSSICLCPLDKFGSKCYLKHLSYQSHNNPCLNNGQCIQTNDRINKNGYICLCNEDYMGLNCEYKSNRIDIILKTDVIPSLIFAHFITVFNDKKHERLTKFKKIPFDQHSVPLYIGQSFHILFIEFFNNSYLTVLREKFIPSEHISADVKNDNMCVNITKLLNSTILNYEGIRRTKYYHLPCVQNSKLKCFYDEQYMCVCDENRFSNCFEFDHTVSYDCQGYNDCENDGKCFEDNATCPTKSVCMCEKCYYGDKCQLTTKGFSLSLDVIFGYHIKPSISFTKQSTVVKLTASITIIMFVCGFINGLLSILTFRRKASLEVGCGIYLLTNSFISLSTITIFTIKYWQLVVFQMNVITNRSFISFNCLLTDVLLKVLLSSGDWLNACVAMERAFTVIQATLFNKSKSRYRAKYIIFIILLLTSVSYIHDPIYRELFYDKDEERTWCIVNYSSNLKVFDKFISLFHFLTPFIINFLSALIIIIQVFRIRSKAQQKSERKTVLYAEIRRHRHLLISPCILIILALPRLIISFSSRCMESADDPWLFLVGYYISFVPPLLIFIVFVLPSQKYKDEFLTIVKKTRLFSR